MAHSVVLQSTDPVALVFEMLQTMQREEGSWTADGREFTSLDEGRALVLTEPDTIDIVELDCEADGSPQLGAVLGRVKLVKQEVT